MPFAFLYDRQTLVETLLRSEHRYLGKNTCRICQYPLMLRIRHIHLPILLTKRKEKGADKVTCITILSFTTSVWIFGSTQNGSSNTVLTAEKRIRNRQVHLTIRLKSIKHSFCQLRISRKSTNKRILPARYERTGRTKYYR